MTKYLTEQIVSEMLGIKPRQVRQLAQEGKLPSVKIGKAVRFPQDRLETFLEQREQERMTKGGQQWGDEKRNEAIPQAEAERERVNRIRKETHAKDS